MTLLLALVVPAVLVAAPVPKEKNRLIEVEGTTWQSIGDTGFGETVYQFKKDGRIEYRYNGTTYKNGSWKQDGTNFTYELNNNYYVFKGEIEGNIIVGKATNKPGGTWQYKLQRTDER